MNKIKKYKLITVLILSLLANNLVQSQSNSQMNKNYIILRDEFPMTELRVREFEETQNIRFPEDYRKFILEYNGGVVVPNYPRSEKLTTEIFPIERFYSLQDIEFGVVDNQREIRVYVKEDIENNEFDIDFDKLIFIGVCERGNIHIYCGKNGNGEIYYSNYSGGLGLEKTGLFSFTELFENLSTLDEDWKFDENNPAYKNWQSDKIFTFEYSFHWTDDIKELSLERFKEVLSFYGDPNQIHRFKETDVVSFYLNNPIVLKYLVNSGAKFPNKLERINNLESLKFLVSKGANIEGILNSTSNIEVIKFLIEECKQDLNKPFEGKYPLLNFTNLDGGYSDWSRNNQYKLIKEVLELGYELNLNVTDEKGQSVKNKIKILEDHHKKYIEKYGKE